jgi:hypothetical protein
VRTAYLAKVHLDQREGGMRQAVARRVAIEQPIVKLGGEGLELAKRDCRRQLRR